MNISNLIKKISYVAAVVQRAFLFILLTTLALAMLLEISVRYIFNQSIFGLSDFIGYASVWLYAIGASYGTRLRHHIKAEFINDMVKSDRVRHGFSLIAALISLLMSAIFTKWSYELCLYSISVGEKTHAYPLPKVIFQSSFFIGGILMTIYFFWEAVEGVINLKENRAFIPVEEFNKES